MTDAVLYDVDDDVTAASGMSTPAAVQHSDVLQSHTCTVVTTDQ